MYYILTEGFAKAKSIEELKQVLIDHADVVDALRRNTDQTGYIWAQNAYAYYSKELGVYVGPKRVKARRVQWKLRGR